jgi:hypothetical protein
VAAGDRDEQGVLGNLPRSRPGVRSDKRGGGRRASAGAAAGPSGGGAASSGGGKASPFARASTPARAKPKASAPPKPKPKPKAPARAKPKAAAAKPKARAAARPKPPAAPHGDPLVDRDPAPPTREEPRRESSDPLSGAVRIAGKVAETGLKAVGGLLRRLPGR